jgi:acyl carrier protein
MTPQASRSSVSKAQVADWLIDWIAKETRMPAAGIETGHSLLQYSLSSVTATILVGDLEDWLGCQLPPTIVWDYPSIDEMADFVVSTATSQLAHAAGSATSRAFDARPKADASRLLEGLDQLSDEEVDKLLGELAASERGGT